MASINVLHLGGPTLMLEMGGLTFLTDPTLDPPRSYPMPVGSLAKTGTPARSHDELSGQVDVVLLSHDQHPDNLDVAGRRLLGTIEHVITTPSAAGRIPAVCGLEPWASTHVTAPSGDVITITAVPARHGPTELERVLGEVTGFLLEAPGQPTVYVSGDNAGLEHVEELGRRAGRVDLAVVFAGAPQLPQVTGTAVLGLAAADVMTLADLLPDALVVVAHTEGWSHFTESRQDVETMASRRALADRVRVPAPGTGLMVTVDATAGRPVATAT